MCREGGISFSEGGAINMKYRFWTDIYGRPPLKIKQSLQRGY
jgi:hypothetical protein